MRTAVRPLLLAIVAAGLLAGCAMGSSEFSCPGVPEGMACTSTREVYDRTDGSMNARSSSEESQAEATARDRDRKRTTGAPAPRSTDKRSSSASQGENGASQSERNQPRAADSRVAERTRQVPIRQKDDLPIRQPAQVMRIWVAPWEDQGGNLHMSGLIYTEIVERRWTIGVPNKDGGSIAQPLTAPGVPNPAQANSQSGPAAEQQPARSPQGSANGASASGNNRSRQ